MRRIEQDFMIVNLAAREVGVLKTIGEREFVATVKLENGADEADNMWLIEQVKLLYQQYYARVGDYKNRSAQGKGEGE